MSCIQSTPVVDNILTDPTTDYGWQAVGTGLITSALSQYYPLAEAVVVLYSQAQTTRQHGVIRQLEFEETASSSANIKKTPLQVLIYSGTAPTTPTAGAVYNASTTNLVGIVEIKDTDYKRLSSTVWVATVNPDLYYRVTSAAGAANMYAVVLSNSATSVTYASSATARIRAFTEQGTAL